VGPPGPGVTFGSVAQAAVPRGIGLTEWLGDPDTWLGRDGILSSALDTITISAAVMGVAIVIAVPLAAVLAHYGRGELTLTWFVTLSRAVPTFAVAALLVPVALRQGWGFEPWPIFIALLVMALPPIYLNTYTAVRQVEPGAVDAARAMGLTEPAVLLRVEVALATSVIFSGIRVSAVQVVATEPIRAFLGGDGLGRYVRDGLGQNNDTLVIGGALLVATLAALTGFAFGVFQRVFVPYGVRRLGRS
jgi:osmoprotectant transport system permease protein